MKLVGGRLLLEEGCHLGWDLRVSNLTLPYFQFILCTMFAVENLISQLPAQTTCCHPCPAINGLLSLSLES